MHEHDGCPHEHEGMDCPLPHVEPDGDEVSPEIAEIVAEAAVEIAEIEAETEQHQIDASLEHHQIEADLEETRIEAETEEVVEAVEELVEAVEELEEAHEPEVILVEDTGEESSEEMTADEVEEGEPAGDEALAVAPPPRVEPEPKKKNVRRSRFTARHSR